MKDEFIITIQEIEEDKRTFIQTNVSVSGQTVFFLRESVGPDTRERHLRLAAKACMRHR